MEKLKSLIWERIWVNIDLDPENLLTKVLQVVEGGLGGDAVDEDEALAVLHVQVTHRGELFLHKGTELIIHI